MPRCIENHKVVLNTPALGALIKNPVQNARCCAPQNHYEGKLPPEFGVQLKNRCKMPGSFAPEFILWMIFHADTAETDFHYFSPDTGRGGGLQLFYNCHGPTGSVSTTGRTHCHCGSMHSVFTTLRNKIILMALRYPRCETGSVCAGTCR